MGFTASPAQWGQSVTLEFPYPSFEDHIATLRLWLETAEPTYSARPAAMAVLERRLRRPSSVGAMRDGRRPSVRLDPTC